MQTKGILMEIFKEILRTSSNLVDVSAFGAPEFSDLMNVSAKEILAILNAAVLPVLPVLPVLLCCCAAVPLCRCAAVLLCCCAAVLLSCASIKKS